MGSPAQIGVPRFELGTSPTRTERATRLRHTPSAAKGSASADILARVPGSVLRAVLFDVDFTLFRPGPELGPEGYRRIGERHGLTLDPARYADARLAAIEALSAERDLVHDEQVWIAFTEQIVRGMGGEADAARDAAIAMVREWERHENFTLFEDALPAIDELRRHGLKIGLVT